MQTKIISITEKKGRTLQKYRIINLFNISNEKNFKIRINELLICHSFEEITTAIIKKIETARLTPRDISIINTRLKINFSEHYRKLPPAIQENFNELVIKARQKVYGNL